MSGADDEPSRPELPLRPSPDVIARRLDGAGVLVHLPTNRIFELNVTGIRIWELIGNHETFASIVNHLVDEFDVEAEEATAQLSECIRKFRREGLVEA
jgi:hypothetical protein